MTREEFAKQYAKRSGLSVQRLLALGIVITRCRCDNPSCPGWQALTLEGYQREINDGWQSKDDVEETRKWTLGAMGAGV